MKQATMFAKLILALGVFTGLAMADYTLDFNVSAPTTGSLSYAGGSTPLIGTNISVDTIVGLNNTPKNNGVTENCLGCFLNFTTGNFTSYAPFGPSGAWLFEAGGTITLSGTIDVNHNGLVDGGDITGTFLAGTFDGTVSVLDPSGQGFKIAGASFGNTVDPALAAYYGLPTESGRVYAGGLNLSFFASSAPGGAFSSSTLYSGDITDSVPEPVSIVLLGTALIGCTIVARRRRA